MMDDYDYEYYKYYEDENYAEEIDDNIDYESVVYDEAYFEDEYLSQQIGCLPVFLAVAGSALILVLALFKITRITVPSASASAVTADGSNGLGGASIAPLFTPEVQHWSASIAKWSQQTGIEANLIATVMQIESCGDPKATSGVGAMGLFQVMPYHFESGEDPYKPATNAHRGLDFLRQALTARDDVVRFGFAGYNGGITGAKRPESQWPNETQRFVYWGTGIYKDAVNGKENSGRLDEWLGSGGASLCRQAAQRLGIE